MFLYLKNPRLGETIDTLIAVDAYTLTCEMDFDTTWNNLTDSAFERYNDVVTIYLQPIE